MKGLFHHTIHLSANVELKGDITILCLYDDLVMARTYGVVAFISWGYHSIFPTYTSWRFYSEISETLVVLGR